MRFRLASLNLALLLAAAAGLVGIGMAGNGLTAPPPAAGQPTYEAVATDAQGNPLPHVLLALGIGGADDRDGDRDNAAGDANPPPASFVATAPPARRHRRQRPTPNPSRP